MDGGYRVVSTAEDSSHHSTPYIFISYTRVHFFTTIRADPSMSEEELLQQTSVAQAAVKQLTDFAINAAKQTGVEAFWIDFECVQPETPDDPEASRAMQDVYHICDIVRTSHSMVIVVGPPAESENDHETTDFSTEAQRTWLKQWGHRLWTLPEALLCPSNHGILLCSLGKAQSSIERIEKRNLATYVWEDAEHVRQLVDHYEGTIALSQLELISIALESLQRRHTVPRMNADVIYALMGLMRERVTVLPHQSAFEVFARLSLANDSQMPLERLFCMHPVSQTASWHDMRDLWGARLWDITPECQIIGVAGSETVTIAGMFGAAIQWDPLPQIDFEIIGPQSRTAWQRYRGGAMFLFVGLNVIAFLACAHALVAAVLTDRSLAGNYLLNFQLDFMLLPTTVLLLLYLVMPPWLYRFYKAQPLRVEARFYGFHGVADLDVVDQILFGRAQGRFSWSSLNPQSDSHGPEDEHDLSTYTILDTVTMTANVIRTHERPTLVAVAGKQGGYLRTMLCSFNTTTQSFCRQKVLRMESSITQRMSRMDPAKIMLSTG